MVVKVMITTLVLVVVGLAVILASVSLRDSGIFDASSTEQAQVNQTVGNVSEALTDFFSNTGTIFSILVVVVIILAISIIVLTVKRFGSGGGGL